MAPTNNTRGLVLTVLVVFIATNLMFTRVSADCSSIIPGLVAQCSRFVAKPGPEIPPSPECCQVVKTVDVPCLCKLITPGIEKIISMEKVVFVARTCGVTVTPGMKCGSYTVPPKA